MIIFLVVTLRFLSSSYSSLLYSGSSKCPATLLCSSSPPTYSTTTLSVHLRRIFLGIWILFSARYRMFKECQLKNILETISPQFTHFSPESSLINLAWLGRDLTGVRYQSFSHLYCTQFVFWSVNLSVKTQMSVF